MESKEIVIDIINKYFDECCDEGGGTTGYVQYPYAKANDIVQDLYKVDEFIQYQKAENGELRKKLGRPYVRRFDLENNKLKIENTQLKQQLEEIHKSLDDKNKFLQEMGISTNVEFKKVNKIITEKNRQLEVAKKALNEIIKSDCSGLKCHTCKGFYRRDNDKACKEDYLRELAKQALSQTQKVGE